MIAYTGNGPYCYSDSLHMCLRSAGIEEQVTSGLIECLAGMPFGAGFFCFGDQPMLFPASPAMEPDKGVSQALRALGWTCDETRTDNADDAEGALRRLRAAALPAQVGPTNMGRLTYDPSHAHLEGSDHYLTVLEVGEDSVRVHDPAGHPFAVLPLSDFMQAWKAEGVSYGPFARPLKYVLRTNFRRMESLSRGEVLARGLTHLREVLAVELNGPEAFSGPAAFRAAADTVCQGKGEAMHGQLMWFSLPLGARRGMDAAFFLTECGEAEGAACMERKAKLYGEAQYHAVHRNWDVLADRFERLAETEQAFRDAML